MHITEYKAIKSRSIDNLNIEVNRLIDDGWQPKDHIIVANTTSSIPDTIYIQVMYR
jgi:hypothetical protein